MSSQDKIMIPREMLEENLGCRLVDTRPPDQQTPITEFKLSELPRYKIRAMDDLAGAFGSVVVVLILVGGPSVPMLFNVSFLDWPFYVVGGYLLLSVVMATWIIYYVTRRDNLLVMFLNRTLRKGLVPEDEIESMKQEIAWRKEDGWL